MVAHVNEDYVWWQWERRDSADRPSEPAVQQALAFMRAPSNGPELDCLRLASLFDKYQRARQGAAMRAPVPTATEQVADATGQWQRATATILKTVFATSVAPYRTAAAVSAFLASPRASAPDFGHGL